MRLAPHNNGLGFALLFARSDLDSSGGLACRVEMDLHRSSTLRGETFDSTFSAADLCLVIVSKFHFPFRSLYP